MTEPEHAPAPPATSAPGPVDDHRRTDPPPAAAPVPDEDAAQSEAQRQTTETVRSISRLEESNSPEGSSTSAPHDE